ncbi:hypothetical protein FLONG3_96 [Fusarium longipes]|uniref:C2H2-type domain-containing protein n=1 Tax=Fusarium longipes TaxID=694270 RepID=A0A395TBS0_9HYPO|nr:hypothetical protein FLONG3_96 [Fusarium longipes]
MLGGTGAPIFTPDEERHLKRLEHDAHTGAKWAAVNIPKENTEPEPARIVSDLNGTALKTSQAKLSSMLASNPKIQAAQSEWEKKIRPQSHIRPPSIGSGVPSLRPPQPHRKRESPSSDVSAAPASKRQNGEFDTTPRQQALRFTEEEVTRQMSELTAQSQKHFATPNELLKKYTGQASPTPVPLPVSAPVQTPVATPPTKSPAVGDVVIPIIIAEGDRPYTAYPSPNGETTSACGALIPPKYKEHDDPELRFVCPVRDCRRLFDKLRGLGGHFGAGHCSSTFNDNGDGTLSRVGSYQKNGPGGTPGIIVSRNPLPANAPPPVDPGLSVFATFQQNRNSRAEQPSKRPSRSQETPVLPPVPLVRSSTSDSNVKAFLHLYLSADQTEYHREDIDFMLSLPRKRDLTDSWKEGHRGKTLDINHYACALAFITGREVDADEQCTAARSTTKLTARPTARLSTPCIALPTGMPTTAVQAFSPLKTCVGCKYWCHLQRRSNACDWNPHPMPRNRTSGGSARSSSSEDATPTMDVDEEDPDEPSAVAEVHELMQTKRRSSARTLADTTVKQSTVGTGSNQMGGMELEMEDWEVAPGRMKDDSSSDNIAFSNSYLTSGQPVTVSEDISFNVIVLKPGTSSHWNVEDDKLRTCSVAAGKVRVTMGEQTFQLGPNGMFVVRPGQSCKVENRIYVDSVVHCTTIGDFALQ